MKNGKKMSVTLSVFSLPIPVLFQFFHLPVPRLRFNNIIGLGSPQNWTVLKSKQNKTN